MELRGVRALIVEDEPFLRLELSDLLEECGCEVVGLAGQVQPAVQLVTDTAFDIALLDVNLGGERIDPVVEAVERRGAAFLYLTGYGASALEGRSHAVVVDKPFERTRLVEAMLQALGRKS